MKKKENKVYLSPSFEYFTSSVKTTTGHFSFSSYLKKEQKLGLTKCFLSDSARADRNHSPQGLLEGCDHACTTSDVLGETKRGLHIALNFYGRSWEKKKFTSKKSLCEREGERARDGWEWVTRGWGGWGGGAVDRILTMSTVLLHEWRGGGRGGEIEGLEQWGASEKGQNSEVLDVHNMRKSVRQTDRKTRQTEGERRRKEVRGEERETVRQRKWQEKVWHGQQVSWYCCRCWCCILVEISCFCCCWWWWVFQRKKSMLFPYHWYSTSPETLSSVMHSAKNYAYIIMCH